MGLWSWWKRSRAHEDEVGEEIRSHLAMATAERVADGEDRMSAELASRKDFGNVLLATEAARRVWTPWWLEAGRDLASDVRYAVRTLAKNPAFSLAVVIVLTLGIGLNAAVFTMLKGIVLTPLAGVQRSADLVAVYGETSTGRQVQLSYPDYQYVRDHHRAFSELMGTIVAKVGLGRAGGARTVWAELVSGNYFQVLGVRAQLGRTLLPSDEVAPGLHPVVVLSNGLWRRDFGADPGIVGRTVEINSHPLTVAGVADPQFHGTIVSYDVELYVPVMTAPQLGFNFGSSETTPSGILADRRATVFYPQGRLRPGATLESAAAEAEALWAAPSRERPLTEAAQRLRVAPFYRFPNSGQTFILPTLGVLSAMGVLVLLIACANIAGLVLVRGVSRRGEIAVRLALGATRTRIVRLLIVENLVLALPGAVLGVLLAATGIPVLVGYAEWLAAPQRLFLNVDLDRLVVGFAAFAGCACALVVGFVPALQSTRVDLVSAINESGSSRGAARGRLRAGLVVAQVAVSLLLLVGAGLATRSVDAARAAHPGFDARQVTAVAVDVKQNGYDEAAGRVFYRRLLEAARAQAGIESATLAAFTPMALLDSRPQRVAIEGYEPRPGEDVALLWNPVGPDYFRTLRIPLRAGRAFEDRDHEHAAPVAVVNDTFAQRYWGGASRAIGRQVQVGEGAWRTVIGVAADVKYARINEAPRPYVYVPFLQSYRSSMVLHTRGTGSVEHLVEQARAAVVALDPQMPVLSSRPLLEQTRGALLFFDLTATMLFIFGLAGMALAAMGTYGLVSYSVKESTQEIGIRMTLGASRLQVVRGFLRRGLRLGAVGAGLGVVAALGLGRVLGGALFGVSATDAVSFTSALTIVLAVVVLATLVPAWRAARTNPLVALRHQ